MNPEHFKWITLDSGATEGATSLRQHGFIPKVMKRKYTLEQFVGNISLCGRIYADDGEGNEEVGEWINLKSEPREANACKLCQRKADNFLKTKLP